MRTPQTKTRDQGGQADKVQGSVDLNLAKSMGGACTLLIIAYVLCLVYAGMNECGRNSAKEINLKQEKRK